MSSFHKFFVIFSVMTKTGKPDIYWAAFLKEYANGRKKFSSGQRPKTKKWKAAVKNIESCPRHNNASGKDMFGNVLVCLCTYHDQVCYSPFSLHTITIKRIAMMSAGCIMGLVTYKLVFQDNDKAALSFIFSLCVFL